MLNAPHWHVGQVFCGMCMRIILSSSGCLMPGRYQDGYKSSRSEEVMGVADSETEALLGVCCR